MNRQPIDSSSIRSVGFDKGTLEVEFTSGTVYQYQDIPESLYRTLLESESVGSFFQRNIRPQYTGVKLPEPEDK